MNDTDPIAAFDGWMDEALAHLTDSSSQVFAAIQGGLEGFYGAILWLLGLAPSYVVALAIGLLGWRLVGWRFGALAAAALAVCELMNLWPETIGTLALVIAATLLALAIAIPAGILSGYVPALDRLATPVLDLLQTLPPYIYLLPGIALLGYGPATALVSTLVVAVPPAFRLAALGMRMAPVEYIELGMATGMTRWQMFAKIRLPFALPSIMAGINQSLMMAFGMVVIAGIVGSGGLGQTIYDAIRKLDIAKSIDAAIAIVILTMILDRLSQSAGRSGSRRRKA
ncbi:ABC transporter permease [Castellaniella defragrans]|jgi:glycine betaine/proline transport system permease protein|uniref:L-proline glycine betaine ABC transport system permease protein ProW n=2 Tax=Castellaniella defragrans TaxID=75697 RepID=W8X918_CASD6|nr:ABC transporter permease subunit [Castellaniella defragrans]KAB0623549.1 ABC transporter permease subunit [Castellaniella defragrans]MBB6083964.1 glycine betaine/proline transport system permease protein [Castellaniella defragrans]CDM24050.1 L-proline glycine betaine ABC transport system permease protein ProW [Castellaniella defragrans 65Phen]